MLADRQFNVSYEFLNYLVSHGFVITAKAFFARLPRDKFPDLRFRLLSLLSTVSTEVECYTSQPLSSEQTDELDDLRGFQYYSSFLYSNFTPSSLDQFSKGSVGTYSFLEISSRF